MWLPGWKHACGKAIGKSGKEGDMTIRTLILSGSGGRGAFHAGVCEYLCQKKPKWDPDIVVGMSIGAVNGAAIMQGISSGRLNASGSIWKRATSKGCRQACTVRLIEEPDGC